MTKLIFTVGDASGWISVGISVSVWSTAGDSALGVPKLSTGFSKGANVGSVDTGEFAAQADNIRGSILKKARDF